MSRTCHLLDRTEYILLGKPHICNYLSYLFKILFPIHSHWLFWWAAQTCLIFFLYMICAIKWRNCRQEASFLKTTVSASWQEKFGILSLISLNILICGIHVWILCVAFSDQILLQCKELFIQGCSHVKILTLPPPPPMLMLNVSLLSLPAFFMVISFHRVWKTRPELNWT